MAAAKATSNLRNCPGAAGPAGPIIRRSHGDSAHPSASSLTESESRGETSKVIRPVQRAPGLDPHCSVVLFPTSTAVAIDRVCF